MTVWRLRYCGKVYSRSTTRSVPRAGGGNEFEVNHGYTAKGQKGQELVGVVGIARKIHDASLAWRWVDADEEAGDDWSGCETLSRNSTQQPILISDLRDWEIRMTSIAFTWPSGSYEILAYHGEEHDRTCLKPIRTSNLGMTKILQLFRTPSYT